MKSSLRPRSTTATIAALLVGGCLGSTPAARKDAATDARDASADHASDASDASDAATGKDLADALGLPDADAPQPRPDTVPDFISPPDGPLDLPADAPAPDSVPPTPGLDSAIDPPAASDLPPAGGEDGPLDAPDATTVGPDGRRADGVAVPLDAATPDAQRDADPSHFRVTVVPNRALDLIFVIDNSPSMVEKQVKLKAQFPKLIEALKDPMTGDLPDLRLAILDQDLGTGGAYAAGSCGPKTLPDAGTSNYGDLGRFQMIGAAGCGVTVPGSLWLEHKRGQPLNYTGDIATVFTCLAGNLGTLGCGEEHTLQALEFALVGSGIGNEDQHAMLRPEAYLGLVLVTDEDDCSAATNDGIFGDKPELRGESASLRCSTRAHACGGTNLTASPPGYPTTAPFTAPLLSCGARTDACPNPTDGTTATDTSVPTTCSPLKSIARLAQEMKSLKRRPDEQVFVAGIFGWPLNDAELAAATYKIAPIPNPNTYDTQHPTVYDVWPICYDPNHPPINADLATGFDAEAAYWGGAPGLRLAAFIDEFGDHGMKMSICQPDFSAAMSKIGAALARPTASLCTAARSDGYAGCTATYLLPDGNGNLVRDAAAMAMCNAGRTNVPCFSLVTDATQCPAGEQVIQVTGGRPAIDGGALPPGTLLEIDCE